jgi:hypothetical protein
MIFSDATSKNGLIQECEFWTNLGDGTISGDTTLKAVFANRLNRAFDSVLPLVLSKNDKMRWDDPNHTDHPIATFDLVSGQNDYTMLEDEDGLSILNITDVMILPAASSTQYMRLRRMTLDEPRALRAMSPNPTDIGIPSAFLEKGNVIFFNWTPNYSATDGGKVFFERIPEYFTATGNDTLSPGIPVPFQPLLALYASLDWLLVNKPDAATLITRLEARIAQMRSDLDHYTDQRNPTRGRIIGRMTKSI